MRSSLDISTLALTGVAVVPAVVASLNESSSYH